MLQAYSLNVDVAADTAVPFNNVSLKKGCTAVLNGASTIELNKCGVYMVSFDASSAAVSSVQLYKDGVALPDAQGIGTNPSFCKLVAVSESNNTCCSVPTTLQVKNIDTAEAAFDNVNIVVTKIC